ncbi:ABC transporter permease subunit [Streptomyces sp. NBC_01017]|uniref:ABC transporter permease subunit n=1 Tax=Streptomyces sp. NBC_00180 TaxID=2903632 RepID=A0AAU1IC44_9ACTN|nr:ABC transporter permease subunit [Streptomyces sp. NBC_01017]
MTGLSQRPLPSPLSPEHEAALLPSSPSRRTRRQTMLRWTVLLPLGGFFLLPLIAMVEFSTREVQGRRGLQAWAAIADTPELVSAIATSLALSGLTTVLTLALLVPTLTWVRLKLPKIRRLVEALCLLPLVIPAIVLVVGIAPVYTWVARLLGESPLTLTFSYTVLALPYASRAIDIGLTAMDLPTLVEAARGLGASWLTVLVRVVVPNMRGALMAAALLTVSVVLGEFTLASLLNFSNLQVEIDLLSKSNAESAVAVSLAAIIFVFALLFAVSAVSYRRSRPIDQDHA